MRSICPLHQQNRAVSYNQGTDADAGDIGSRSIDLFILDGLRPVIAFNALP